MLIHEDFVRCKECNNNQFIKETRLVINKEILEITGRAFTQQELTDYICSECGKVLLSQNDTYSPSTN